MQINIKSIYMPVPNENIAAYNNNEVCSSQHGTII